ncbi:Chromosome partition protein Smc [Maioricimonas rarisocia]|uniref:Chromosome partition protein Smc n=1 Tax=Maioricimonas rarisocia TaxID=2528026 RepID=A0A517Z5J4_9PLAN|nr:DUF1549 domain-containing protein [Maioricimonas rarisocia]QDU37727.1 Chromosome partition protein Smc [Maioricimonas rarisocia]
MKTLLVSLALCSVVSVSPSLANDALLPLHRQIDELTARHEVGPVAPAAEDAEFVRRVYVDLTGRIPSAEETRVFLDDSSAEKRTALIDRLLESDECIRHLATTLDVMLMERRGGKHVKIAEWRGWLEQALRDDVPLTQIAAVVLAADGTDEKERAAAAFYLEREAEPDLLTRDIGRKFFGRDLQCAQCHNHPLIDDYYQTDYYGIRAFVGRLSLFQPDRKKPALLGETAVGEAAFKSVFTEREGMTGPRLPGGAELAQVALAPDQLYEVAPAKNVRPVPKFSRREKLAELVAAGGNRAFDRNMANRLWAMMMGRGIVDPVDLHHSDNPPAHPELLDALTTSLVGMDYSVRGFLRQIALSQAYQRSSILPGEFAFDPEAGRAEIATLQSQAMQLRETASEADARAEQALEKLDAALQQARPLRDETKKAADAILAAAKTRDEAAAKVAEHQKTVTGKRAIQVAVQAAASATMGAVKAAKDDKELAQALTLLTGKATQVESEVAAAITALQAAQGTAGKADAALTAARRAWQEKSSALAGVEEQVRNHRAAMVAAREQATGQRTLANHADERSEFLQTLISWREQETQLARLADQKVAAGASLAKLESQMPPLQQAVADSEKHVDESKKQLAAAQAAAKAADSELQAARETAGLLTESLAKVEAARSRLEASENLDVVVTKLGDTIENWQATVAGREDALKAATAARADAQSAMTTADAELKAARAAMAQAQEKVSVQKQQIAELTAQIESTRAVREETWTSISDDAAARFHVASLVGLSPEQLTRSLLTATGQIDRMRAAAAAKYDKDNPRKGDDPLSDEAAAARSAAIDAAIEQAVDKVTTGFVKLFGNGAGQPQDEFFATVDQALFIANGGEIRSWLSPGGGNLTERLEKLEDSAALAEELYLATLTRQPTPEEAADVVRYLEERKDDRRGAIQELAWAMVSSAEFRFRH